MHLSPQGGEAMPNIKSAEKRMKTSAFQRLRNRSRRSALRTAVKKFEKSLDTGVEKAEELLAATMKERSEEHTSELQSRPHLVCRLLLEKKNNTTRTTEL